MLIRRSIPIALALLAASASAAEAGTVSRASGAVTIDLSGDQTDDTLIIGEDNGGSLIIRATSAGTALSGAGGGCTGTTNVTCIAGTTRVSVLLGPGDDTATAHPNVAANLHPVGAPVDFAGGDGRDVLIGGDGKDVFGGGEGVDLVSYGYGTTTAKIRITLNNVADDGALDGAEGDDVRADVEDLLGGRGDDTLTGDDDSNTLTGGPGNDVMDGGKGFDVYYGDEGNDDITARDGNPERVDCGPDNDRSDRDTGDDAADCERGEARSDLESDLDKDGYPAPADCRDDNAAINPGATEVPDNEFDEDCRNGAATTRDRDGDGQATPEDCDDTNPAAKRGNKELYGNGVDEDCNGRADPLQTIEAAIRSTFISMPRSRTTAVRRLLVANVLADTTIRVTCVRKRACPLKRDLVRVQHTAADSVNIRKLANLRKVRAGAVLEVRVIREDSIDRLNRYRFRRGKSPVITPLCQRSGASRPSACL